MFSITGIFITTKNREESLKVFEHFFQKYQNRVFSNNKQELALCKSYCNDALKVIKACFVYEMWGPNRCIKRISELQMNDSVNKVCAIEMEVANIMMGLKNIVLTAIPINELPSCKGLIELSVTDAISAMNDLGRSGIVKTMICIILLGKNISDIYKISDIENFYISQVKELEREISENGRELNNTERFLLDKFYAEICYCYKARLKTNMGIAKETYSIIENADEKIRRYEEQILPPDSSRLIK